MSQIAVSLILAAGLIAAVWTTIAMGRQRQATYSTMAVVVGLVCLSGLVVVRPEKPGGQIPTPLLKAAPFTPAFDVPEFVRFDPHTYKGPAGKIVVPDCKSARLILERKKGSRDQIISLTTTNGEFVAPTGTFTTATLTEDAKLGAVSWALILYSDSKLSVLPNSPTRLNLGQPLVASVKVTHSRPNRVIMDLRMLGRGGERCTVNSSGKSKDPSFQVLKNGKVIWSGKFEAG